MTLALNIAANASAMEAAMSGNGVAVATELGQMKNCDRERFGPSGMPPATMIVAPNSPSERAKPRSAAAAMLRPRAAG